MEKLYQSKGKIPSKSDYQTQIIPIHSKAQKWSLVRAFLMIRWHWPKLQSKPNVLGRSNFPDASWIGPHQLSTGKIHFWNFPHTSTHLSICHFHPWIEIQYLGTVLRIKHENFASLDKTRFVAKCEKIAFSVLSFNGRNCMRRAAILPWHFLYLWLL